MADYSIAETKARQRPTQQERDTGEILSGRLDPGRPDNSELSASGRDEKHLSSMRLSVVLGIAMVLAVLIYVLAAIF
jgi:hypothetical protein